MTPARPSRGTCVSEYEHGRSSLPASAMLCTSHPLTTIHHFLTLTVDRTRCRQHLRSVERGQMPTHRSHESVANARDSQSRRPRSPLGLEPAEQHYLPKDDVCATVTQSNNMSKPNDRVRSSSQRPAQRCRNSTSRAAGHTSGKRLFQICPSDCFISGSSLHQRQCFETNTHVVWPYVCTFNIPINDQACTKKGSNQQ